MANLERGSRRFTWVVSLVLAVPLVVLGLYGFTQDSTFSLSIILIAAGLFALSWLAFFALRWIARGFRDSQATKRPEESDKTEEEENSDDPPISWWRNLLRPFVKPFRFSYYNRPHCRHPAVWKDSWGVIHVVCGEPPVDQFDVQALEEALRRLKSGDHDYVGELLPGLLRATMDENGGGVVPVCQGHANKIWGKLSELFDHATEEEQQGFKDWIATRKQTGTS